VESEEAVLNTVHRRRKKIDKIPLLRLSANKWKPVSKFNSLLPDVQARTFLLHSLSFLNKLKFCQHKLIMRNRILHAVSRPPHKMLTIIA
jgi:hypothetical protein